MKKCYLHLGICLQDLKLYLQKKNVLKWSATVLGVITSFIIIFRTTLELSFDIFYTPIFYLAVVIVFWSQTYFLQPCLKNNQLWPCLSPYLPYFSICKIFL